MEGHTGKFGGNATVIYKIIMGQNSHFRVKLLHYKS